MGDLLRAHQHFCPDGNLANDDLVYSILDQRLAQEKNFDRHLILDGFPRSHAQAIWLTKKLSIAKTLIPWFFQLLVPEHLLRERAVGRWTHLASGRTYQESELLITQNRSLNFRDTITGDLLIKRSDDLHFDHRLAIYNNQISEIKSEILQTVEGNWTEVKGETSTSIAAQIIEKLQMVSMGSSLPATTTTTD